MIPGMTNHVGRACRGVYRHLRAQARVVQVRCYSDDKKKEYIPPGGSFRSPLTILKEEFEPLMNMQVKGIEHEIPRHTDILIIGGGIVGSATAYWIKSAAGEGLDVTVVEKDYGYTQASTMLSAGGVRHQFSVPENVQLSKFTSHFLENIREYLSVVDQDPPQIQYHFQGYLFLGREEHAETMAKNVQMQISQGAKIALFTKSQLAEKFPWLNLDGIDVGSYGMEGEGWFDPWQLVNAFKLKNTCLGVRYCSGDVTKIRFEKKRGVSGEMVKVMKGVDVDHPNGKVYGCDSAIIINCGGPWAGKIAEMAGIGDGYGNANNQLLPVEPRKRYVYVVHCPDAPTLDMPFVVDPSGVYVRREGLGGNYICGASPASEYAYKRDSSRTSEDEEPDISDLNVDYEFFNEVVWPKLAERIPAFNNSKLRSAWAGYYDYNYIDQNLIIGGHPYFSNFVFANGMSGHGVQQGVGVGRAISELVMEGRYETIDLSRFRFSRFQENEVIVEDAIV